MQHNCSDGSVMVQGTCIKDAEFFIRGEKNTHITRFSLSIGKSKDTTTIYANCKAFGKMADIASGIKKGDSVLAIGKQQSREHNGKTYTDLMCDWIGFAGQDLELPARPAPHADGDDTDNDLPF